MPAKNSFRIEEEGIYSHIYNKGVEKRIIFNDKEDYEVFLGFLKDYLTAPKDRESTKKVFQVHGRSFRGTPHQPKNYLNKIELIAYSLMPDRFHLLLHQITRGSLESFIRSLCTRYSIYFNKKYQRTGALFQGPYKSVLVKGPQLPYLTRYLHHTDGYSSYPEYLGARVTSWVKPKVVQSFFETVKTDLFQKTHSYKDFVEKYEPNQKEEEFLQGITFEDRTQHLERRNLSRSEKVSLDPDLEPRSRTPEFLVLSVVVFLVLVTLGIRNIQISMANGSQSLPTPVVLGETEEVKPTKEIAPTVEVRPTAEVKPTEEVITLEEVKPEEKITPTEEVKLKVILTVRIGDGSPAVNIRQKPTTYSEKIGSAIDGDTFELVSKDAGWYEVKLADGSTGFITSKYILKDQTNN